MVVQVAQVAVVLPVNIPQVGLLVLRALLIPVAVVVVVPLQVILVVAVDLAWPSSAMPAHKSLLAAVCLLQVAIPYINLLVLAHWHQYRELVT
jgi:hypothetical protein